MSGQDYESRIWRRLAQLAEQKLGVEIPMARR